MTGKCLVCSSNDWQPLPEINETQSVRTDGGIVEVPLAKYHCLNCGLVKRSEDFTSPTALDNLYRSSYSLYQNRPRSEEFETSRYRALAESITKALGITAPKRVLEVGCGNGSLLVEMQKLWPTTEFIGMEPSSSAVKMAKEFGRNVVQGMIGKTIPPEVTGNYDAIYSVHVLEHTPHPTKFLDGLKSLLKSDGRIYVSCPDGRIEQAEITHPDHLFTMTPSHLAAFAGAAGLTILTQDSAPTGDSLEYSQMLVAKPGAQAEMKFSADRKEADRMLEARLKYLAIWKHLEAELQKRLNNAEKIFCFGTGGWAALLAGYAPVLWNKIEACVIDKGSDAEFFGKRIIAFNELAGHSPDAVLAAVNPATQPFIKKKLENEKFTAVTWNDLIQV